MINNEKVFVYTISMEPNDLTDDDDLIEPSFAAEEDIALEEEESSFPVE